ncbi:MAG TPA: hypothetical protein VGI31_07180 [Streptosporangiaceae bacterium]
MRGERALLRAGEYLARRASRRLPASIRDERYREWTAELPVILHDPDVRPSLRRAGRMLSFAADTLRGTALPSSQGWYRGTHRGRGSGKKDARMLMILVGLLTLFFLLAASLYWLIYVSFTIPGHDYWLSSLAWWTTSLIIGLVMWRRRGKDFPWFAASCVPMSAWQFAHEHGWPAGCPQLLAACLSVIFLADPAIVIVLRIRSLAARRWPQVQHWRPHVPK